jgi:hypothetical protein
MFTRRIFMQGTAAILGGLLTAPSASRAQEADEPVVIAIDSIETPFVAAAPERQHLRLSGTQLYRFNRLSDLFAAPKPLRVDAFLDGTGQVLLETALNAAGRSVIQRNLRDGVLGLNVRRA